MAVHSTPVTGGGQWSGTRQQGPLESTKCRWDSGLPHHVSLIPQNILSAWSYFPACKHSVYSGATRTV